MDYAVFSDESRHTIAVVDVLLAHVTSGVRADVLIWDTQDSRHDIPDRDDIANYPRGNEGLRVLTADGTT